MSDKTNASGNQQNLPHEEGQMNNIAPNSNNNSASMADMKQPASDEQKEKERSVQQDQRQP